MVSVIVIGAGLGGIAAAARLARQGYQVSVYEKAPMPGGRTAVVEQMEQHLELKRIDPTYRVHFQNGSHLDLTSNLVSMREQLEAMEPGSFEAYLKFLAEGYRHYHLYDVFNRRAYVPGWEKLSRLPGIWYRTQKGDFSCA